MKFSERMGYTKPKDVIQYDSIDDDLKNDLWNLYYGNYLEAAEYQEIYLLPANLKTYFKKLWTDFIKKKINEIPEQAYTFIKLVEADFFDSTKAWYFIYDLIEYTFNTFEFHRIDDKSYFNHQIESQLNSILEKNLSGYRFINKQFVPITNDQEIASINEASNNNTEYKTISSHLNKALELLSDKKTPDFSNSIKESISAIESYFKVFFNNPNIKFGDALNNLEHAHGLDKQIKESINKIYAFSNNVGAIRHALKPGETPDKIKLAEAKYMLVTCSAFINYLKETSTK